MSMTMVCHGGQCCGIKHIYGFPYAPTDTVAAITAVKAVMGAGSEMAKGAYFYPNAEPKEEAIVRLKKLLAFVDLHKTEHLVEIVLNDYVLKGWKTTLKKLGFKEVTKFKNSNTGSRLHVLHRVTPVPKPPSAKKEEPKPSSKPVTRATRVRARSNIFGPTIPFC